MKAEEVLEVEINVGCLQIRHPQRGTLYLNRGRKVSREDEPELLEALTKSMANVGEEEDATIRVTKKKGDKKAAKKSESKTKKGGSKKKSKKESKKSKGSKKSKKDSKDDKVDE